MAFDFSARLSRRSVLSTVLAAALLPATGRARGDNRAILRVGMAALAQPFSWLETATGGTEAIRGIIPETLRIAFDQEGSRAVTFQAYPWPRAQRAVEEGMLDGFCTNVTPDRERYAVFGDEPVSVNEFAVFTTAAHPRLDDMRRIASPADLTDFRQVDYIGNGFAETLFADFRNRILWQRELETVFRLIANGRADLAYVNETTGRFMLARMGLSQRFAVLPIRLSPPSVYRLGLRRSYPEAAPLLARMDLIIRGLRRQGTIESIVAALI
jgi:polar amino acid transport system substrate-binding protein